jgi:hypothetical protein
MEPKVQIFLILLRQLTQEKYVYHRCIKRLMIPSLLSLKQK